MPTITAKRVHLLEEGDIIHGVGTVVAVAQFASGVSIDVNLTALDKLATIGFAPIWRGFEPVDEFTARGTGWEWPTVPVVI